MIELMNGSTKGKKVPKFELVSSAASNVGPRPITFQRGGYAYAYGDNGTTFFKKTSLANPGAGWAGVTINNNNTDGYGGVVNDTFVLGFGTNGGQTRTFVRRMLMVSESWTTDAPAAPSHGTSSAYGTVRNRLYSFGGAGRGFGVMYYDIVANAWTTVPNTVFNPGSRGAAGSDGVNMYCIAGLTTSPNLNPADFYRLNYGDNTWTKLASLNYSLYGASQLCYLNGKLYCIGGIDSTLGSKLSFVAYDIASNTWEYLAVPGNITGDNGCGLVTDGTRLFYISYAKNQVWKITI